MSLREINEQIERELSQPEPDMVPRIWIDEEGKVQSERVPNRQSEGIRSAVEWVGRDASERRAAA